MAFIYDLTDTWNAGGTTFNAIKMNVTDTASAAASKLITVQVSGSERFGVDKAGNVLIGNGGDLLLSSATGGNNTTLYNDAQDLYIATNGSTRMYINSSGNVGIGTTSPSAVGSRTTVNVSGSAGSAIRLSDDTANTFIDYTDGSGARISVNAAEPLLFQTNSLERMRIDSSGNVAIGGTTANARLEVMAPSTTSSDIAFFSNSNGAHKALFRLDAQGDGELVLRDAGNNEDVVITAGGDSYLNGGNVGIGTTSPGDKLTVVSSTTTGISVVRAGSDRVRAFGDGTLTWGATANQGTLTWNANLAVVQANAGNALAFNTNGTAERMRIDSSGTIIAGATAGIANARAHFQRNSDANYTGGVTVGTSSAQLVLRDVSNTTTYPDCYTSLLFGEGATGAHWQYIAGVRNAGLVFGTATGSTPTERMRIDSSGNVGIGTSSPSAKLHVSGTSATSAVVERTSSDTNCNIEYRGSATSVYAGKGAGDIWAVGSAADLSNATTTKFVVDTGSGNVGVGTTSPNTKLTVEGSACEVAINDSAGSIAGLRFRTSGSTKGVIQADSTSNLRFSSGTTERVRITSDGQWRWGDTATIDTVSYLPFQITNGIAINTTSTSPQSAMSFFNGQGSGTRVGWIGTSSSSTSYNTSSDQRLKENIADADDAGALIDTIQVRQFDWRLNGEHQAYGMVAQELDNVYPDAVSHGPTEDDMMAVDYSKLVPMLVKEIQSLRARVAQLEGQ